MFRLLGFTLPLLCLSTALIDALRPSLFGMFVYKDVTSIVTSRVPSGTCPSLDRRLRKSFVSLRYDLTLTYRVEKVINEL